MLGCCLRAGSMVVRFSSDCAGVIAPGDPRIVMSNAMELRPARLSSVGVYLPEKRASNRERAQALGVDQGFLESKIGVVERAIKDETETTSSLCVKAFGALRAELKIDLAKIDALCVVTRNEVEIPPEALADLRSIKDITNFLNAD